MTFQKQLNLANKKFIEAGRRLLEKKYAIAVNLYADALDKYNSIVNNTQFAEDVKPESSAIRHDILQNIQHEYCNLAFAYFYSGQLEQAKDTYYAAITKGYLQLSYIVNSGHSVESQILTITNKLANDKYNKLIISLINDHSMQQLDELLKEDNISLPIKVNICCAILQQQDLCTKDMWNSVIQFINENHKNTELQEQLQEHINYLLCQAIIVGSLLDYNIIDLKELATTEHFNAIEDHALYLLGQDNTCDAKRIFNDLKVLGHNEDIVEGYLINLDAADI